MKKTKILIFTVALISFTSLFLFIPQRYLSPINTKSQEQPNTATLTLKIKDVSHVLTFTPGQTLYQILTSEVNKKNIPITGKEYSGLGFFITQIGPLQSGQGTYLVYYINGTQATEGISAYTPHPGDNIEWKLEIDTMSQN
jgi:NAD(P)H-flavin reductase